MKSISAVAALALLYMDKVDHLGMFLGVVMMGMVALFLVVVLIMGLVISSLTIMTFITRLFSSLDKFHHRMTFITTLPSS